MDDLKDDLLDGVSAIAAFTGWPERRVYYFAEKASFLSLKSESGNGADANQPCGATSNPLSPSVPSEWPEHAWMQQRPRSGLRSL